MSLQERTTAIDPGNLESAMSVLGELDLLSGAEAAEVRAMLDPAFPLAGVLAAAESIHLHIKVDDVATLPSARILAAGPRPESETEGYVKYPFAGGVNVIFSSIPISMDDMLDDEPPAPPAVLDHKGIDLRLPDQATRSAFDTVPATVAAQGWRHIGQGGDGTPVYCCHTEVEEKHWVYPVPGQAGQYRPIEVAFGELKIHDTKMGCDLRPIDPAHPRAAEAAAALSTCAASHAAGAPAGDGSSYYQTADLAHFAGVGRFAKPLMGRFWSYYNDVFGQDGALTKREKALIGLAVAHSKQCPYCIDSFTNGCLDAGATVEEMHESVHAAAALAAGIDLVHAVQMQNVLSRRGAI
ncbi:MAG: arsenosugar biosynthesis-associated peroxidase-like protein [Acidimicrobiales bacterium]